MSNIPIRFQFDPDTIEIIDDDSDIEEDQKQNAALSNATKLNLKYEDIIPFYQKLNYRCKKGIIYHI